MIIPVIETERLILRAPTLADFPAHFALWSHPVTLTHFGGVTYSEEETWMRFRAHHGGWNLCGYGMWGVEDKQSGRYMGSLGFFRAMRPLDPAFRDDPESGWAIHPDFHGRGLAGEAMTAAAQWADANIDAPQSWCMINPANAPSRRVAERLGYVEHNTVTYRDHPAVILTRPRGRKAAPDNERGR